MGRRKLVVAPDDPLTLKAAALYRNGATLKASAQAVYMSAPSLKRRFDELGIKTREPLKGRPGRKPLSPEEIEKIRQERQAGKLCGQIAQEYRMSPTTITKYTKDIIPDVKSVGRNTVIPDDPVNQKAIELYQNGATLSEVAAAVNISRRGLTYRFKVLGIPIREIASGKRIPQEIAEAIRREYVPHKNGYLKLAEKYGVGVTTVKNYVKKG